MDTTTPADGVEETQPAQTTEAVADSHKDDQAIVIDDNGREERSENRPN